MANTCEKYDPLTNSWGDVSSLIIGRSGASATSFDNKFIYVFGGRNSTVSNQNPSLCI